MTCGLDANALELVCETIDLCCLVVEIEGGPGHGCVAAFSESWSCREITCSDRDAALIQNSGHFTRVDPLNSEADDADPLVGASGTKNGDPSQARESLEHVPHKLDVVVMNLHPPDLRHKTNGSFPTDGCRDVRAPCFELVGSPAVLRRGEFDALSHMPTAKLIGWHGIEQFATSPKGSDAHRSAHFMGRQGEKVAPERLDIYRDVRSRLRAG